MKTGILTKRIAIMITLLLLMFQWSALVPHKASAATVDNAAMIAVVDENGKEILPLTVVPLTKDETAFDVLKKATSKKDIDLQYDEYEGMGANITKIGNSKPNYSEGGFYWNFVINGVASQVGVSSYKVKEGDDILFKVVNSPETVKATVTAKNKNGAEIFPKTDVEVIKGANGYDVLKQAAAQNKIQLEASIDETYFAFINNLANTTKGDSDYWSPSLNDEAMNIGLSSYLVQEGDHFQLDLVGFDTPSDNNSNDEEKPGNDESEPAKEETNPISKQQLQSAIKSSSSYVLKNGGTDEFEVVALQKSGQTVPAAYLNNIKKTLKENDGTFRNVTDYERVAIGVSAAGGNATNIEGYNLIKKIYSNERMTNQGTNGVVYALLAYDSKKYEVPASAKWTREKLVNYLVDNQLKDGGWSLYGDSPSVDITAMTLTALAPYKDQENVKLAINNAVKWLSTQQDEKGGYSDTTNGGDASETIAQVIIGLSSVGVNPSDKQFTKSGSNLIQHLLEFQKADGGFAHIKADKDANLMASTQALIGLTAYQQYLNGTGLVYQFDQKDISNGQNKNDDQATNESNPTTQQTDKSKTGQTLPNTATNQYNLLVIGAILLVFGAVLYVNSRKKRA